MNARRCEQGSEVRVVVQWVSSAALSVEENGCAREHARIGVGLVAMVGIERGDDAADRDWMAEKLANLRIFPDDEGRMNRSVLDAGGEILLVPNFTVAGDARKGRRPSFDGAMRPPETETEFDRLVEAVRSKSVRAQTGAFGAHMHVELVNDGPVTIWLDSAERQRPRRG